MSCQEIMCIENIIDLQATYSVLSLSLSNLIEEILEELKKGIIPILEIRVFLQSLKSVTLTDEAKGELLLNALITYMNELIFLEQSMWTPTKIMKYILKLQNLILWDYHISGSLVIYNDNNIKWDMDVCFVLDKEKIEI